MSGQVTVRNVAQREARLDVNSYVTQALMNKHGWAHAQVVESIALSQELLAGPGANAVADYKQMIVDSHAGDIVYTPLFSGVPGSYLARETNGINPGNGYIRIALVASIDECIEAARRINAYAATL